MGNTMGNTMAKFIPAMQWMQNYNKIDLPKDMMAALIVAIMLIPQGMAYAMLAGLPPVVGLYASTLPLILYAVFGTSRQLAVGPVAIVSMMVFAAVTPLAQAGTPDYIRIVLILALMTGIIQLLLGVLRLGFLVNFMSHAVISGFTSASALIIGFSQLKTILGVNLKSEATIFHLMFEAILRWQEANGITLTIGVLSILLLLLFKKKYKKIPGPLVVVFFSTVLVYFGGLQQYGVKIIGDIPKGIPAFSLPNLDSHLLLSLLPAALTISFVGFMESVAVAKAIAAKEKYKIEPNQELIGLGMANTVTAFFSGYPVTGGFSRTAVNYQAGARTPLASIFTAVIIGITLLFLTPLFYYLPNAVLASIIIVAVAGLIDVKEARYLFKVKKTDGMTLLITFLSTLLIGIEAGIVIGILFSLLVFILRSAYPHIAELGYLEKENIFRNILRFPHAKTYADTCILRVDASLYFANMAYLENYLQEKISGKPDIKQLIFDFSAVNDMDSVALHALETLMEIYDKQGIVFYFSNIKGPVRDLMARAGWHEKFGDKIGFVSIAAALDGVHRRASMEN